MPKHPTSVPITWMIPLYFDPLYVNCNTIPLQIYKTWDLLCSKSCVLVVIPISWWSLKVLKRILQKWLSIKVFYCNTLLCESLLVSNIRAREQWDDVFTEPLLSSRFTALRDKLRLFDKLSLAATPPAQRGDIMSRREVYSSVVFGPSGLMLQAL